MRKMILKAFLLSTVASMTTLGAVLIAAVPSSAASSSESPAMVEVVRARSAGGGAAVELTVRYSCFKGSGAYLSAQLNQSRGAATPVNLNQTSIVVRCTGARQTTKLSFPGPYRWRNARASAEVSLITSCAESACPVGRAFRVVRVRPVAGPGSPQGVTVHSVRRVAAGAAVAAKVSYTCAPGEVTEITFLLSQVQRTSEKAVQSGYSAQTAVCDNQRHTLRVGMMSSALPWRKGRAALTTSFTCTDGTPCLIGGTRSVKV